MNFAFCILSSVAFGMALATAVLASTPDELSGRIIGTADGQTFDLPLLNSHYQVDIQGDMASVTLTQTFANPATLPMRAEYLFPLNQHAAVYGMEMEIGDEVITAQIRKKKEAEQVFAQAETAGKSAVLLTQHRPNMFTQKIANLMPGQPVSVTLSYVQSVPKIDGEYQLILPMVVGPRYQRKLPPPDVVATLEEHAEMSIGEWSLEPAPLHPPVAGVSLPSHIAHERVSLDLLLESPLPIHYLTSDTHALAQDEQETAFRAEFADGQVIDNADLVIRYQLGGETTLAGILTHPNGSGGGTMSVMISPPMDLSTTQPQPRELVFLLDTSGSMRGAPMEASKRFMTSALNGLRPTDHFRILTFANTTQQYNVAPVAADPAAVAQAIDYVGHIRAKGGTEIDQAVHAAFSTTPLPGALRIVVFLSDGYIGDEATVLKTIRAQIGDARIYAFGVGGSVNRYLLDAMADEGGGYARYIDPTKPASETAETLARDLKSPVLTDLTIDWGDADVTGQTPARLPDLFHGNSLRVLAQYANTANTTIQVRGKQNGRDVVLPISADLTRNVPTPRARALPLIWARTRIADLERTRAVGGGSPAQIDAQITELGLTHRLQTRLTSFVAVSNAVVNPTGLPARTVNVALPQVKGVPAAVHSNGFSGASTPEPRTWAALVVLLALLMLRMTHKSRRVS
jgi:Ca-activated chloride channel family protein